MLRTTSRQSGRAARILIACRPAITNRRGALVSTRLWTIGTALTLRKQPVPKIDADPTKCAVCGLQWQAARDMVAEIEQLRAALEFYANPFGKCEQVPDFYRELGFGDRAQDALEQKVGNK